jgi:hypothetical protein
VTFAIVYRHHGLFAVAVVVVVIVIFIINIFAVWK